MSAWLPNGKLSNGTLLMGPLKEMPKDGGDVIEVVIDDTRWYVRYSGLLHPGLYPELEQWAKQRVASYKKQETRTVGSAVGGAILGASLGGPVGLLIGLAAGAFIASGVNEADEKKDANG